MSVCLLRTIGPAVTVIVMLLSVNEGGGGDVLWKGLTTETLMFCYINGSCLPTAGV